MLCSAGAAVGRRLAPHCAGVSPVYTPLLSCLLCHVLCFGLWEGHGDRGAARPRARRHGGDPILRSLNMPPRGRPMVSDGGSGKFLLILTGGFWIPVELIRALWRVWHLYAWPELREEAPRYHTERRHRRLHALRQYRPCVALAFTRSLTRAERSNSRLGPRPGGGRSRGQFKNAAILNTLMEAYSAI